MLPLVAEKVLPTAVRPELVACCPTMDLIALVTIDEQLHVFRFKGQKVFSITSRKIARIVQLRWKPDGRLLAVADEASVISLVESHSGKVVHQIECAQYSESQICCLGWGFNVIDPPATKQLLEQLKNRHDLEDFLSQGLSPLAAEMPVDLPTELAFLDIDGVLPKLSVLPLSGKDDEVFSTRSSLDSLFHSSRKDSSRTADALVAAFEDGTLHLSIYDFFEIGSFNLGKRYGVKQHFSHPYSSTHGLLVSDRVPTGARLSLMPVDLQLVPDTGKYLFLIASKSTQLQNILRYIADTYAQMSAEFTTSQDLPRKFIRNIEETLQEKDEGNFIGAMYQLVATGYCNPSIKEWLVDELGERGQKRWEKAAITGYENLRRLTHENLIPGLERFSVLASRLRGLSRFHETNTALGLDVLQFDQIFDTLSCMQLLAHTILVHASTELQQAMAFLHWLRHEIEVQAAAASSPGGETAEKDAMLDYPRILEYVPGALQGSALFELFEFPIKTESKAMWDIDSEPDSIYPKYKIEVRTRRQGQESTRRLPGLKTLLSRLDSQCKAVFGRMGEMQKRKVRVAELVPLEDGHSDCFDARMVVPASGSSIPSFADADSVRRKDAGENDLTRSISFIAVASADLHSVRIHKVTLQVTNGISSTTKHELASIQLPQDVKIRLVGYVDDQRLLLNYVDEASSCLAIVPYQPGVAREGGLVYVDVDRRKKGSTSKAEGVFDLSNRKDLERHQRQAFSRKASWSPGTIDVSGREGRRTACTFSKDKIHYRIYGLDPVTEDGLTQATSEGQGQDHYGEVEMAL